MDEIKLKPCPFCGTNVYLVKYLDADDKKNIWCHVEINCINCEANISLKEIVGFGSAISIVNSVAKDLTNDIIERWNSRMEE